MEQREERNKEERGEERIGGMSQKRGEKRIKPVKYKIQDNTIE